MVLIPGRGPEQGSTYLADTRKPTETPQVAQPNTPDPEELKKKYDINGQVYSLSDLYQLRAACHTKARMSGGGDPFSVLCHPDMDKHGLGWLRPGNCPGTIRPLRPTHPAVWRQKGRELGIPAYDYGESFRTFFNKMIIKDVCF